MPSILWHQGRGNPEPSPREGEGDTNVSGEGYLKNLQKALSQRPLHQSFSDLFRESSLNQHLCNNKANLLTRLETRCNKILGTGPRMTGAGWATLLPPAVLLLPLTRSDAPTSPARGEVAGFVLNVLFPRVSFFLPNPAKTC